MGVAVGLGGAVVAARSLKTLLYGVTATDVTTYAVVVAVIGVAAMVAAWVPARRASRVDPVVALRD
jgi:ABC-type antimicrobial peptide transport system permease subunit